MLSNNRIGFYRGLLIRYEFERRKERILTYVQSWTELNWCYIFKNNIEKSKLISNNL